MSAKPKKLAVTFAITAILLSVALTNMKIAFSGDNRGKIDLFTQKEPFSGKGLNVPSDAFSLGEEVQIYALATYYDDPVQNILVAFEILGPRNPFENITVYRVASTNETGMAMVSFRIPYSNKTALGEWSATGNARIGDLTFQDSVTFRAGWIIEIVSIRTVGEDGKEQEKFMIGTRVGIELTLQNIAMTMKKARVTVTIYDSLNIPINSMELSNLELQPDGTPVPVYFSLYIPINAHLGQATVYACAYTTSIGFSGVPCCHEVSKSFSIVNRDVAVLDVKASPSVVYKGEIVYINVTVSNKGSEFESFNVTVYGNETLIDMMLVNLDPFSNATIGFIWNTSYAEGSYLISAFAGTVPSETYDTDNRFDDGIVKVKPPITAPKGWFVPSWFYWLLLLLILIVASLVVWLYHRKRRKKAEEAFHSGWTAWYYCYDLRRKIRKV